MIQIPLKRRGVVPMYEKPEMEIIEFSIEDVITNSGVVQASAEEPLPEWY